MKGFSAAAWDSCGISETDETPHEAKRRRKLGARPRKANARALNPSNKYLLEYLWENHFFSALEPKWGVKKNSEGKNVFLYGYKAHLAVGASSQYILGSLFSSGSLNDGKAAIPLLKEFHERVQLPTLRYAIMDAGYDYEAIYTQIHQMKLQAVIAYYKRNESE